ncbi:MAG TPA: rubrerythrin family protein [Acholeplasmataceae bacterium]|nr:rubrerythrin family protein [Acholeplasmataceae bacterium]
MLTAKQIKDIKVLQRRELTDHYLYLKLANRQKNEHNKEVLKKIAQDEWRHYHFWKKLTNVEMSPNKLQLIFYYFLSIIFGITFGIRLMERGEHKTQYLYKDLQGKVDNIDKLIQDEEEHEEQLIDAFKEEKLNYVGSMVLGLNDALVELTGTLAGLTFGLADARIVAFSGLIVGIAASFSMASSEYLSKKQEESHGKALKSALYTGFAYIITVVLMIIPYLIIPDNVYNIFGLNVPSIYISLAITLLVVILIILLFNFYISVAKRLNFKKRFGEMMVISLGVAILSFFVGYLVKMLFGIDL